MNELSQMHQSGLKTGCVMDPGLKKYDSTYF